MASSRIVFGCLLVLFVGFILIAIWIVDNSENEVDITVQAADVHDRTLSTPGNGYNNLELSKISKILKTLHNRWNKDIITTGKAPDQPVNVADPTPRIDEWSPHAPDDQHIVTIRSNGSHMGWNQLTSFTMLSNRNTRATTCNQMTYVSKTALRWIKVLCGRLKSQPPIIRVGLLVLVVLSCLILTTIGYKLMCPRVHRREGIEKIYDMEDSWLMFA